MTGWEKMLAVAPYDPADPEPAAARDRAQRLLLRFNAAPEAADRAALLQELPGGIGLGTEIRPAPPAIAAPISASARAAS